MSLQAILLRMSASGSRTVRWVPRGVLLVSSPNQRSTRFSLEALVVQCRWKRGAR